MNDRWEAFAKARGWTLTHLIREAVHAFIKNESQDAAAAPAILKKLDSIATKKQEQQADLEEVNRQLKERVERLESQYTQFAVNVTPSVEDKERIMVAITNGKYALKELAAMLSMPVDRTNAVLRELKSFGIATQNEHFKWYAIKQTED